MLESRQSVHEDTLAGVHNNCGGWRNAEMSGEQSVFRRNERYEINNASFQEIHVKQDWVVARGGS
jgi:hypothetical protein